MTKTAQEFANELKAQVDAFVEHWESKTKLDPVHWPLEMTDGQWDEQFISWSNSLYQEEEIKRN